MDSKEVDKILQEHIENTKHLSPDEVLKYVASIADNYAVFTSSLGEEDQLLTYYLSKLKSSIKLVTLDTGRLFPETYELLALTQQKFDITIEVQYPEKEDLEHFVNNMGINAFYDSVDARKNCCHIRKVIPLQRALAGHKIWITGIRSEQSENRQNMPQWEWDERMKIFKVHPLLNTTQSELEQLIKWYKIPTNPLHKLGYKSIGCAPCTRAIEPGEHPRSGRWWWEMDKKECGLHRLN